MMGFVCQLAAASLQFAVPERRAVVCVHLLSVSNLQTLFNLLQSKCYVSALDLQCLKMHVYDCYSDLMEACSLEWRVDILEGTTVRQLGAQRGRRFSCM